MTKKLRCSSSESSVRSVGKRLRGIRIGRRLSQADLERSAGLLKSQISRLETGQRTPSLRTLERLAKALDVPLYFLFYPDATSALPTEERRNAGAELLRGVTAKNQEAPDTFYTELQEALLRLNDAGRATVLAAARRMARRVAPPQKPEDGGKSP